MVQISQQPVRGHRNPELDYMKAVAIFFMVMQHSIETIANFDSEEMAPVGVFQNAMEFSWEFLCAAIFIFSIGFGLSYTRKNSPAQLARRGLKLLRNAYLLNIARGVLPMLVIWLVKRELDPETLYFNLFNVDVFHFAACLYFLAALLKKCSVNRHAFIPIGILMLCCTFLFDRFVGPVESPILQPVLALFIPCSDLCYFPLFNYFIFGAIGFAAGRFFSERSLSDGFFRGMFWSCLVIFAGSCLTAHFRGRPIRPYYDMSLQDLFVDLRQVLLEMTVMLGEFAFFHLIHRHVREDGKLYGFIRFCGIKLTAIYVIHWILLGWLNVPMYLFDIPGGSFEITALFSIVLTLVSIGIAKLLAIPRRESA